jgi:hypothetical protein
MVNNTQNPAAAATAAVAPTTNNVMITRNKQSGLVITPYKKLGADGIQKGYVVLTEESDEISGQWLNSETKSCLMKGAMDKLQKLVDKYGKTGLPGKLVVREYVQSQVPFEDFERYLGEDYLTDFNKKAEASGLMKRAGNKGVWLTLDTEPIWRFTEYDPTGTREDIRVQHDNGAAVRADYAAQREKQAQAAAAHQQSLNPVNNPVNPVNPVVNPVSPAGGEPDPFAGMDEATKQIVLAQIAQQKAAIAQQPAPGVDATGATL